jgi:tetratricopeptide (TPR) repeat protein
MRDLSTKLNHAAWALAVAGKYQQAFDIYVEARSRGFKLSAPDASNCGFFLLCLENYEEALAQFREAATKATDREGAYLENVGAAQWLLGRHRDAAMTWRHRVSGLLNGTILYADFAGGASDGLLLWYAAVTLKDDELLNYAMEYFRTLSAPSRLSSWPNISSWPGPLVYLALGERSAEVILEEQFGDKKPESLLRRNADILRRRQLAKALFFFAVKHRADGREQECRILMSTVAQIENPLIELEWYLARGELS